jgi:anti-sigma factor RsiW
MAGEHPRQSTLLEYVEDELDLTSRAAVEAHLAECEVCAADVKLARAGREAAREAPLLEAPAGLTTRVLDEIAPRPRPRVAEGRRWLRIVVPVAAALALAAGISTIAVLGPGGGDDEEGAGQDAAMAEEAGGEFAPEPAQTTKTGAASGRTTLSKVEVNPPKLAAKLRRRGFDARVENGAVVVRTERRRALRLYLQALSRGPVPVQAE